VSLFNSFSFHDLMSDHQSNIRLSLRSAFPYF